MHFSCSPLTYVYSIRYNCVVTFFSFMNSMSLGSSPTFLMTLFVMCVACLVGAGVMIFKKSRDRPAGYTVLATSDQE